MSSRKAIYYWKCDRPSAFRTLTHTWLDPETVHKIQSTLVDQLQRLFDGEVFVLKPGKGQGNHLTFVAEFKTKSFFIRVENGPEKDNYMEVEAHVLKLVRNKGVPTPIVYFSDSSRKRVPYSFQVLQYFNTPDLNFWHKNGELNLLQLAESIGQNIAKWQTVETKGYGPFNADVLSTTNSLQGLHSHYTDYFFLNLEKHLSFLVENRTLSGEESNRIIRIINEHRYLLNLEKGCLVHKDLALWNILGSPKKIKAFIDWDDTIAGDPTDDLSLLACFHSQEVIDAAIKGYTTISELPDNFYPRFWLHLLRNMIVKAVIRVGGGYFAKKNDFFLIGNSGSSASLEEITRQRILAAIDGLSAQKEVFQL